MKLLYKPANLASDKYQDGSSVFNSDKLRLNLKEHQPYQRELDDSP